MPAPAHETRTVQILALGRWDSTIAVSVPAQAETSAEDARSIMLALDDQIAKVRGLACDYDAASDSCVWGCEVFVDGEWYPVSMEDHFHESAEIHW